MAENLSQLRGESLTPTRAAVIASKLSDEVTTSFNRDGDGNIDEVRVKFVGSVMNECDYLIRNQDFTISPKSGRNNFVELYHYL
jgi:hypothetical protein